MVFLLHVHVYQFKLFYLFLDSRTSGNAFFQQLLVLHATNLSLFLQYFFKL